MIQEQKIIRGKVGMLELVRQLGNVAQVCRRMGYLRDSFYDSGSCTIEVAKPRCGRCFTIGHCFKNRGDRRSRLP
ncbi:hypothetical protein [Burkholderia sp. RS02]|uniref:hypothetical protein n=1 Tax=unclassified Burkholderia TaxID=2613784 RepID=UPI0032187F8D